MQTRYEVHTVDLGRISKMDDPHFTTNELPGSQSVDRALRLLALVGRGAERGAQLSEIVQESGLNKPTARRRCLMRAPIWALTVQSDARGMAGLPWFMRQLHHK